MGVDSFLQNFPCLVNGPGATLLSFQWPHGPAVKVDRRRRSE